MKLRLDSLSQLAVKKMLLTFCPRKTRCSRTRLGRYLEIVIGPKPSLPYLGPIDGECLNKFRMFSMYCTLYCTVSDPLSMWETSKVQKDPDRADEDLHLSG